MNKLFSSLNIGNWILGSVVCILLTVIFSPYLESQFQTLVVRLLGWLQISSKHKLSGKWTHTWHVQSDSFASINIVKSVEIKQFRNRIYAKYKVLDNNEKEYTYHVLGRLRNGQVITGTWRDVQAGNRYYGCFQLFVDVNENQLNGYWTGISNKERIKSGKWEWVRE
jgi:hypothetical protein